MRKFTKVGLYVGLGGIGLWQLFSWSGSTTPVIFGHQDVDPERFIAIAAPFREGTSHQLLILEQVTNQRPCWREQGTNPVLVDLLLLNFNFVGICGRSTDSNGYSIRMARQDLALQYRLGIVKNENSLRLIGVPTTKAAPVLTLGSTNGITKGFAKIQLALGWRLTRRTLNDQPIGHIYLTSDQPPPVEVANLLPPPGSVTPLNPQPMPMKQPSSVIPRSIPPFADLIGTIYESEIRQAISAGLISGFYEDNTFRPELSLTREQMISLVIETLRKLPKSSITLPTQFTDPYPDVPATRWSAAKIQFSRNHAMVTGYQDGTFQPTKPVTRAELVVALYRAVQFYQRSLALTTQITPRSPALNFTDLDRHWARNIIKEMATYCQVASPFNEKGTQFLPDAPALRHYGAVAALRMFNCTAALQSPRV